VTLAAVQTEAEDRNQVVKMLGVAGRQLREKLGEPRASLREFNKPLEDATSSSVEALQALSQIKPTDHQECVIHAKRAVELDLNFAAAYGTLGTCYFNLGQNSLARQNLTRDYELRDRENREQRLVTEVGYYHYVTGELDKLMQSLTTWGQTYPAARAEARTELGSLLIHRGQWEKAAAEDQEALRLAPGESDPPNDLMLADMALNRLQEARNVFDEARARNLDGLHLRLQRYRLAFLLGDRAQMEEQVAWAMGKPKVENWMLWAESDSATYYGRVRKAREFLRRAVQSALKDDAPDTAAGWQAFHAWAEAEIGNSGRAQEMAAESLGLSAGREVGSTAGLALARAGDTAQAQKMAEKLNQEFPLDTLMQNCSLPAIRAAIELEKNNPAKAIESLKTATPCELGNDLTGGKLVPVYLRGEAYLKAGQAKEAAAEFQKIIDHPGIVLNYVHGALARLQLGRAQVMMGDKDAARKSYQGFLTLWKDADPDTPIYKQAKAEYARLR
jgi:tetratricopeptide (TPR) repeat protein